MRQALFIGGHPAGRPPLKPRYAGAVEWVDVEGGTAEIGAAPGDWAYDNERPRHAVALDPFRITRSPITNATFMHFVEGGGYERREWWSDEGWAWKEEYDITHPRVATRTFRNWDLPQRRQLFAGVRLARDPEERP
jgi:iron(II)-dependent oxidoreductase